MVPLADFCNHSYTRSLSHFEFSSGGKEGSDCVSLVCDTDVRSGEEVHICYGPKTTAQLLSFYGFEMGMPVPCDELHVVLLVPLVSARSRDTPTSADICGKNCCGNFSADACLDFLSQCCLNITDDNSVACTLLSGPPSLESDSTTPASTLTSSTNVASCLPTSCSTPHHCLSHHRIVHSQPCIDIPTVIANCIQTFRSSACESKSCCGLGCKENATITALPAQAHSEGIDWLQVIFSPRKRDCCLVKFDLQDLRDMVAFEQTQVKVAESSGSFDGCFPSDSHNVSWELRSFRKAYGEAADFALRWFKGALDKLLVHLDSGNIRFGQNLHLAASQAAAYRSCMCRVIEQQLLLLQGCDLSSS
jgi:hypothetical protein